MNVATLDIIVEDTVRDFQSTVVVWIPENIFSVTEWCVIGMVLHNRLSMHSQLTPSRIAGTAIGKIWAFKEYSSQPIIHQVSSI